MKWKKVTVHINVEAEDIVSAMLTELGAEGVEIEDNVPLSEEDVKAMFIDILPDPVPSDGKAKVSFYLHEAEPGDEDRRALQIKPGMDKEGILDNSYMISDRIRNEAEIEEFLENVRTGLAELRAYTEIGEGRLEVSETEDVDWRNKWKEFFRPILIERILIIPSWLSIPEEYKGDVKSGKIFPLLMDPGVAFGTGSHETTRLCIPGLVARVNQNSRVLDLGTGSGILGMAAKKLGAECVTAVDIDPACEEVLKENLAMNGIEEENFRIITGNVLSEDGTAEKILKYGPYDIAVANILAPVIVSLAKSGAADRFLKPGGIFITSGILNTCEEEVLDAFRGNGAWTDIVSVSENEWVCISARKV